MTLHIVTDVEAVTLPVGVPAHLRGEQATTDGASAWRRFVAEMKIRRAKVLEIGARAIGSESHPRAAEFAPECRYLGSDIHAGPGIDIVADSHFLSECVGRASVDGVFSVAVLEHLMAPWLVAAEINRVLKPGGLTFHAAPQTWPMHEMPNDFFRMSDQALRVLFGPVTGFEVLESGMASPMRIYPEPSSRHEGLMEMPLARGYGDAFIIARKVADIAQDAVAWRMDRVALEERSRAYPAHGGA